MAKRLAIEAVDLKKIFSKYKKLPGIKGSVKALIQRETYEVRAVESLSVEIEEGELVGLIGENGAGKSTTLKMLSGILKPTSGIVKVLGYIPVERKREYLKQISFVMGNKSQLWWDLPVADSFELQREIYQIPQDEYNRTHNMLVELLGVEELLSSPVRKLSLGERMRCELVLSLLHKPKVIFLDEPTLGLDVIMQKRLREFFVEYNRDNAATIILTSHYMDDVKEVCNRVIMLNQGIKIYDGGLSQLAERYATYKTVTVFLKNKVDSSSLEKDYGAVILSERVVALKVKREEVANIAGRVLKQYEVEDIDIREPGLSDIVRTIYGDRK